MRPVRSWAFDLGLALAFLVGGQVEPLVHTVDGYAGGSVVVSHVLAAALALALVVRRHAPAVALLTSCWAMVLLSLLTAHAFYFWTDLLPLCFVVYPAARLLPGRLGRYAWLVAALAVSSTGVHVAAAREPANIVFSLLMLGGCNLAGRLVRRGSLTRERLRAALGSLAEEQRIAEAAAVQAERSRIAEEVQDVVAHAVGLMLVQVGAARLGLEGRGQRVPDQLRAAELTGRRALVELRRSVGRLDPDGRSAPLEPLPDLSHLPDLVRGFRSAGLDVRLTASATDDLPPGLQLTGYRILQESLTNVLRHAGRVRALVEVAQQDGRLVLEVASPLSPAPSPRLPSGGHGLLGMRERVAMFDGTLSAGAEGDRFVVRAELRVPTDASAPAPVPAEVLP